VVPSPAMSDVLLATSFTICAPMLSSASFSQAIDPAQNALSRGIAVHNLFCHVHVSYRSASTATIRARTSCVSRRRFRPRVRIEAGVRFDESNRSRSQPRVHIEQPYSFSAPG
jgi:hypothetical protein